MPVSKYEAALFDVCTDASVIHLTKYYIAGDEYDNTLASLFEVCKDALLFESSLRDEIILVASEILMETE